jgi:hypothetical protein
MLVEVILCFVIGKFYAVLTVHPLTLHILTNTMH